MSKEPCRSWTLWPQAEKGAVSSFEEAKKVSQGRRFLSSGAEARRLGKNGDSDQKEMHLVRGKDLK